MIDTERETLRTFKESARLDFPRGRKGKPKHVASVHRYALNGCRGIFLEWVQIGGQKYTSKEAVKRFIERLTLQANPRAAESTRTPRQRENAIATAERELAEAGI